MPARRRRSRPARWLARAALGLILLACLLSPALIGGVLPFWTPALAGIAALACALAALGHQVERWPCPHRTAAQGTGRPSDADRETGGHPDQVSTQAPWSGCLEGPACLLGMLLVLPALGAALQLLPLPAALVAALSPQAASVRGAGPLTLDVPATRWELTRSLSLLALALAAVRLGAEHRRSRWILRGLVLGGLLQSAVTAIHLLQNNTTSILGIYPLPRGWEGGLGTFVNRNHAASLLLLTSGITAGMLLEHGGTRWRVLVGAALCVQIITLAQSLSRGALAAGAAVGAVLVAAGLRRRMGRRAALLVGLGTSALLLLLAGAILPDLSQRLRSLIDGSLPHYQKVQVWRDVLPLIGDFWTVGVGRGAFQSIFAAYRTGDEYVTVPYAASLPLQHAAEFGLPLTVLLWSLGAALVRDLWRHRHRLGWSERGTAAGLTAVLLHNLVDFGLELPGVSVPTVVGLAIVVARAHRREQPRAEPVWRLARVSVLVAPGAAMAAGAAALLALSVSRQLVSLDKARIRQALRRGDAAQAERLYVDAVQRHPADAQVAVLGASAALLLGRPPEVVLRRTNRALELHPADAQAHRIAAWVLSRSGRPAQAALELRLAFARGIMADETAISEAAALLPPHLLPDALPQHPDVQRRLAVRLAGLGHTDAAMKATRRAEVLAPGW